MLDPEELSVLSKSISVELEIVDTTPASTSNTIAEKGRKPNIEVRIYILFQSGCEIIYLYFLIRYTTVFINNSLLLRFRAQLYHWDFNRIFAVPA